MIISPIHDVELIEETMKLPYVWPYIHDDGVELNDFSPCAPIDGRIDYLGVFNPDYCGFFLLVRQNKITYEIHTVLLKNCRSLHAIKAAKLVIEWIFSNTECERLTTNIPEKNTLAERLAVNAGMQLYGINPHSFKASGVVQSTKLYGVTKG